MSEPNSDQPEPFGVVSCEECGTETVVTFDGKIEGPENCPKCGAPLWEDEELPQPVEKFVSKP